MKSLRDVVSKNNGFVLGDLNPHLELLCQSIQEWIVDEYSPEVQKWVVEEFSPQIEKWVKEYLNNKQTALHISDFCANDKNDSEVLYISGQTKKMGTVEPEYNDEEHVITSAGSIKDNALAFIYGAIKKYGQEPELFNELKEYIINETKYIGENQ